MKETKSKVLAIGYFQEFRDRLELIGIRRLAYSWLLMPWKFFTMPSFRKYLIKISKSASKVPRNIFGYMGYGIYAGKK